jgi:hypothetical protein
MHSTSMRRALSRRSTTLIPMLALALLCAAAGSASLSGVIDIPRQEQKVGGEIKATGSLNPAAGYHFWLLARAHEYDPLWYPQREIQPDLATGKWTTLVTFGTERDVGKTFDIALVAVTPEDHEALQTHWRNSMTSGKWTPMELPSEAEVLATRNVHKVRL